MQFSIAQLMLFVLAACAAFWSINTAGIAFTMFVLTASLVFLIGRIGSIESQFRGVVVGAVVHFCSGCLMMGLGVLREPAHVLALHVVPGAYIAAVTAVWRQMSYLSRIDEPMPPPKLTGTIIDPLGADNPEQG